jgi:5-methylcytosine-specific restriction endonuclease McrA
VPSGDLAEVLDRALVALIEKLERQKLAATDRPRAARPSRGPRHVPAHVRRAVWRRDQGRCTFTSDSGRRCEARDFPEFDHVEPVARGGRATISGIRLRCRAHNQHAAERAFGAGFMLRKREAARESRGAMACADSALDRSGPGNNRICPGHDRVGHARGDPAQGASGRATYPGSRSPTPGPMGQPSM